VSLSTARGSEDAPRQAARLSTETAVDVGRLDRPCSYELRHLSADCPSADTVVLVFTVASQNRVGTQPKEPGARRTGNLLSAEPGPNN
jgi:hypothetical protein